MVACLSTADRRDARYCAQTNEGTNVKNKLFNPIVFISCLFVGIWHEYVSLSISQTGYYKGVVVDKTTGGTGGSTNYLYVDWDGYGKSSIVVHPMTYKRTNIGDKFETQYEYMPMVGAIGTVRVPETGEYGILFALVGVIAKLAVIVMVAAAFKSIRASGILKRTIT